MIEFGPYPSMVIDISDDIKMNKIINENTFEEVNKIKMELNTMNSKLEAEMKKLKDEVNEIYIRIPK